MAFKDNSLMMFPFKEHRGKRSVFATDNWTVPESYQFARDSPILTWFSYSTKVDTPPPKSRKWFHVTYMYSVLLITSPIFKSPTYIHTQKYNPSAVSVLLKHTSTSWGGWGIVFKYTVVGFKYPITPPGKGTQKGSRKKILYFVKNSGTVAPLVVAQRVTCANRIGSTRSPPTSPITTSVQKFGRDSCYTRIKCAPAI